MTGTTAAVAHGGGGGHCLAFSNQAQLTHDGPSMPLVGLVPYSSVGPLDHLVEDPHWFILDRLTYGRSKKKTKHVLARHGKSALRKTCLNVSKGLFHFWKLFRRFLFFHFLFYSLYDFFDGF